MSTAINSTGVLTRPRTVAGIAVPTGILAWIGSERTWEEFAPSAFLESLRHRDVRFLAHHDMGRPIARMSAGSLRLREADDGLHFEADLPDTGDGRDLATLIDRGVISGVSIGFRPTETEHTTAPDGRNLQIHHAADLYEVSAVTWPAYTTTTIRCASPFAAGNRSRLIMARHRAHLAFRR